MLKRYTPIYIICGIIGLTILILIATSIEKLASNECELYKFFDFEFNNLTKKNKLFSSGSEI